MATKRPRSHSEETLPLIFYKDDKAANSLQNAIETAKELLKEAQKNLSSLISEAYEVSSEDEDEDGEIDEELANRIRACQWEIKQTKEDIKHLNAELRGLEVDD